MNRFLTSSDGQDIDSPMFFTINARKLAVLNRKLAHKEKSSRRRGMAKLELVRKYKQVVNQLKDFHYKTAR